MKQENLNQGNIDDALRTEKSKVINELKKEETGPGYGTISK